MRKNEDWKTSTRDVRRLRESSGGGEIDVMLEGFWVRNRVRERLETKLKERGYHGRKAGEQACLRGSGMLEAVVERRLQKGIMGTETLGVKGGRGWALERRFQGGSCDKVRLSRLDTLESVLSLPDGISPGRSTQNLSLVISTWNALLTGLAGRDGGQNIFFC